MADATIPPIRTDWIADASWRLAEQGLEPLRRADGEFSLSDTVDGEVWRIAGSRLSQRSDTTVEIDADVYFPGQEQPTMRAGFTLAPRIDPALGIHIRVRVELGPRGPVTFDPENWIVAVPRGRARPPIEGVAPGVWDYRFTPAGEVGRDLGSLAGDDIDLDGMAPVVTGEDLPELVLGVHARVQRSGVLARLLGARHEKAVRAVVLVTADEPIRAAWQGGAGSDILAGGRLSGVSTAVLEDDRLTLTDATHHVVLHARGLHADVREVAA